MKLFSGPSSPKERSLLARTYGLKNVHTGLIRLVAAYNLHIGAVYYLAMCTFVGVVVFTVAEMTFYQTVRPAQASFGLFTATTAFIWMFLQRDFYIEL